MTLTKDLQAVSKELMKLVMQTEKLAAEIGKEEKPKAKYVKSMAVTKKGAMIRKTSPGF